MLDIGIIFVIIFFLNVFLNPSSHHNSKQKKKSSLSNENQINFKVMVGYKSARIIYLFNNPRRKCTAFGSSLDA
jgi:hypothetical protein